MPEVGRPRAFDAEAAVAAALPLFWQQGYEGTSLAQLRTVMGISSASFYSAFKSKEALFKRVIERYIAGPGSVTNVVGDVNLGGRDAVAQLLHNSIAMQTASGHPKGCLIALSATVGGASVPESAQRAVADQRARDRERIRQCVERAVNCGELIPNTDVVGLTAVIHGFLLGISTQVRDGVAPKDLNGAADALLMAWDALTPGT